MIDRPLPASLRAIEAGLDPATAAGLCVTAWTRSLIWHDPDRDDGYDVEMRYEATVLRDDVHALRIRASEFRKPGVLWLVLAPHEDGEVPIDSGFSADIETAMHLAEHSAVCRVLPDVTIQRRRKPTKGRTAYRKGA